MKLLVIGINPSTKNGQSPTLKTLDKWIETLGIKTYSFTNIYDRPGSFSLRDIQRERLLLEINNSHRVLALGNKVSDVLRLMGIAHFKLPHPSGLNRQLNNQRFITDQLESCRIYLRD